MNYKVGDLVYINYNGDEPSFPYKIINVNGGRITIHVHKAYNSITGWKPLEPESPQNGWFISRSDIIKKVGLELE